MFSFLSLHLIDKFEYDDEHLSLAEKVYSVLIVDERTSASQVAVMYDQPHKRFQEMSPTWQRPTSHYSCGRRSLSPIHSFDWKPRRRGGTSFAFKHHGARASGCNDGTSIFFCHERYGTVATLPIPVTLGTISKRQI